MTAEPLFGFQIQGGRIYVVLKVSKSQNICSWNFIAQTKNEIFDKILP